MSWGCGDEGDELQLAAARIRAMTPEEIDAASSTDVAQMLQTVRAARRAVEEQQRRRAVQSAVGGAAESSGEQPEAGAEASRTEAAEPTESAPDEEAQAVAFARRRGADDEVVESVRGAAGRGELPRMRTAAEYKTWSDDRIAMLRMEPEERLSVKTGIDVTRLGIGEDVPDSAYADEPDYLEASPLLWAFELAETAQRASNEADAQRVRAALTAWRTADALAVGTQNAIVNGPYAQGVLLQIAHTLQIAEQTAAALAHGADKLERFMPKTWRRFMQGEVPWRAMQQVHAAIDGLDDEYLDAFDEAAAGYVVDVETPKLKQRLHTLRERIQARTAPDRHKKALAGLRVEIEPAADGMAWLHALLPAAEAVRIDLELDAAARAAADDPNETHGIGVLRALIFGDVFAEYLARDASAGRDDVLVPQRRGVQCKVGLLIPALTALGHSDVPPVLEGYGPIVPPRTAVTPLARRAGTGSVGPIETAKRLAGGASSWVKVLTDPVTGAVWDIGRDKYRPTSDMRTLLGILDSGGRGPGCRRPPSQTEADHVEPFFQNFGRGATALANLVLLSRRHHRIKTSGNWDIELRPGRDLAWTSIAGTRIITMVDPLEPTPLPKTLQRAA